MPIWFILRPLEIFYGHLVYFVVIWYFGPRKIWQPCLLGDCLLWTVVSKNLEASQIFWAAFSAVRITYLLVCTKKIGWDTF
jgi:hypothetical protein